MRYHRVPLLRPSPLASSSKIRYNFRLMQSTDRIHSNQCNVEGDPKMSRAIPLFAGCGFAVVVALPALTTNVQAQETFFARLQGIEEVPSVSTNASGSFVANLVEGGLEYTLRYDGIETPVLFAHIHFGEARTNGGVAAFLCDNSGDAPSGTPACPNMGGEVTGSIGPEDVVGPEGQGIAPGEFEELIAAIPEDATYANVHSEAFPTGEIRGQIR